MMTTPAARAAGSWGRRLAAILLAAAVVLLGQPPIAGHAEVASVTGSAFGYHAFDIAFDFGSGPQSQPPQGPEPEVELASDASNSPQDASVASAEVSYRPAVLFSSNQINVHTEGALGDGGSVASSADVQGPSQPNDPFHFDSVASQCTADEDGTSASTTITGGQVVSTGGTTDIPTNPAPNTEYTGTVPGANDDFRLVVNEQTTNADGTITVNAAHLYLLGPTATGELIIGQSVCGVTATATTTTTTAPTTTAPTTTTTTTAPPGTTTTTAPPATTTTTAPPTSTTSSPAAATTTTTTTVPDSNQGAAGSDGSGSDATGSSDGDGDDGGVTEVAGGAFGYHAFDIALFGGSQDPAGPAPSVELASDASNSPQDDSVPSAEVKYGPAVLFSSNQITVHTEGSLGDGGSVASSADVQGPPEPNDPFHFDGVASQCTADEDGTSASTTITGGQLVTTDGTTNIPTNPDPGTQYTGTVPGANDDFRITFNEQTTNGDGAITVNAVHLELLGPTATGELIIGQSRCSTVGQAASAGGTRGGAGAGGSGSGSGQLASTGSRPLPLAALAAALVLAGAAVLLRERRYATS